MAVIEEDRLAMEKAAEISSAGKTGLKLPETRLASQLAQHYDPYPTPSPELFEPSNHKRLLKHLIEFQYPKIRDMVGRLLEAHYFLVTPSDLAMKTVSKVILEARQFCPKRPYWGWIGTLAEEALCEMVLGNEEDAAACEPLTDAEGYPSRAKIRETAERVLHPAFNRIPLEERRALYLLAVLRLTIREAEAKAQIEAETLVARARRGLEILRDDLEARGQLETAMGRVVMQDGK